MEYENDMRNAEAVAQFEIELGLRQPSIQCTHPLKIPTNVGPSVWTCYDCEKDFLIPWKAADVVVIDVEKLDYPEIIVIE